MNGWRRWSVLALALTALTGCFEDKKKPAALPPPPEVLVTTPTVKDVPVYLEWVGTLGGLVDAKITAQVTGYLTQQNYREGTFVKKGSTLFTLDQRPFQATLAQAQAQLAQAQANQKLTEITMNRLAPLAKESVVSQQDFDNARQNNAANLAAVQAAKANVDTAQINLGFATIISPIDGIAGIRQANIGDLVGPQGNVQTLTYVSTVNPIYAVFPISEQEYLKAASLLAEVAANTDPNAHARKLQLYLGDGTLWSQPGTLSFADRQVDITTGTITLKALFPNPDNVLRPGQYARVRAVVSEQKNALLIPQRAVQELQGGYFVFVVGADNKIEQKVVTPGVRIDSNWVIDKGLEASSRVVVEGILKVKPGVVVTPKTESTSPSAGASAQKPAGN